MNINLHEDQIYGLNLLRQSITNGHKRIVYAAPTSHGKTIIMGYIASQAAKKTNKNTCRPYRIWVIVDAIELVNQTRDKFSDFFTLDSAVIQGQHEDTDYSKQIQVVMAQTLNNRLKILDVHPKWKPDVILYDEAHMQYKSALQLINMCPGALVIGMTATPLSKGMGKTYTDLVVPSTTGGLIENGRLSKIRYFSCDARLNYKKLKKSSNGDFTAQSSADVLDDALHGEIVPNWERHGQNRKTLIYCSTVEQSKQVQQQFIDAGYPAYQVDGFTHKDMRPEQLKEFESNEPGTVNIMVSVMTMVKGTDIPDAGCLCFYRITRSRKIWIQCLGRVIRKSALYDDAIVLDFGGNIARLGYAEDFNPLDYGLCDGKNNKDTQDEPEQKVRERKERECPNCGFSKKINQDVCPVCNHETIPQPKETNAGEIDVVPGDMKEVKKTPAFNRHKEHSKEQHQAIWSAFLQIANNKGHASHLYKDYYGVWPKGYSNDTIYATDGSIDTAEKFKKSRQIAYANRRNK